MTYLVRENERLIVIYLFIYLNLQDSSGRALREKVPVRFGIVSSVFSEINISITAQNFRMKYIISGKEGYFYYRSFLSLLLLFFKKLVQGVFVLFFAEHICTNLW